jgi:tRNA A-37 threonylcarbamoyl transferase component Bud32
MDQKSRSGFRFPTGRLLAGRYELLERVGEGGSAEVFRARDHRLDRVVAVKVLRPQFGSDATARSRFAVEARSAAALNVSNIVPVYDFGAADDGSLFIVMRYIDGPSLRQILGDHGRLPAAAAADLGRQIAEALSAAHQHGLIHRDVKPGNILVDPAGTAHLTDFGTVKALVGADDLTKSGTIFGTAAYISPEQATGGSIGPATDLYALGVVLYEALSGRQPFEGDDPVALSYRHAHEDPIRLSSLMPTIDPDLESVVTQSLQKNPHDRPHDAATVAMVLERVARRIAPRHAPREALAELVATGSQVAAMEPRAADAETKLVTVPVSSATPEHGGHANVAAAASAATALWDPIERGTAYRLATTKQRSEERRSGGLMGAILLVLALAVVFTLGAVVLARIFGSRSEAPGAALATSSAPRPLATVVVIAPPPFTSPPPISLAPTVAVTPVPSIEPPPTIEPQPTLAPQPTPTSPPTPRNPPPTAAPSEPPPEPPPAPTLSDYTVRIPDGRFVGDFGGAGNGTYHGRTASWIYGQGTAYSQMTAQFSLDQRGVIVGGGSLEIVGLDGENEKHNSMRIELNGVPLFEGPDPLPNDICCNGTGPGNWGSAVFDIPRDVLQSENVLKITNLEPSDCTGCPKFVMVDFVVVTYRARV